MILSKAGTNTMICRCYDAASTATPSYRLQIFSIPGNIYQTITLTDLSTNKDAYQRFSVTGASITVAPGTYHYRIIDAGDSNRVLEQGRITITDTNHQLTENDLAESLTAHTIPTPD